MPLQPLLTDCPTDQVQEPSFVEHFSGNRLLPGSETAAHCYAGHQFGHFSGQLGDGAAIYLGEVCTSAMSSCTVMCLHISQGAATHCMLHVHKSHHHPAPSLPVLVMYSAPTA